MLGLKSKAVTFALQRQINEFKADQTKSSSTTSVISIPLLNKVIDAKNQTTDCHRISRMSEKIAFHAINNLNNEGYKNIQCKVVKTGDVMEDAALFYAKKASEKSTIINQLNLTGKSFILATIHRAENTDNYNNLKGIIDALNKLHESTSVVVPLHPRTKKLIEQHQLKPTFTIVDPLGYFDMISLLQNCTLVITDSGGLQKEAFFFGKFCVTTREQTEWVELVEHGYNTIAGTDTTKIIQLAESALKSSFPEKINLYGNGNACENICNALLIH
jgi:UDP-GlcNAc3NAcA epimerase